MALTEVRIHPAFGIARVGHGDFEFFLGLERRRGYSAPPGGHQDVQSHIKREAVRFRASSYDDESDRRAAKIRAADRQRLTPPRQFLDVVKAR